MKEFDFDEFMIDNSLRKRFQKISGGTCLLEICRYKYSWWKIFVGNLCWESIEYVSIILYKYFFWWDRSNEMYYSETCRIFFSDKIPTKTLSKIWVFLVMRYLNILNRLYIFTTDEKSIQRTLCREFICLSIHSKTLHLQILNIKSISYRKKNFL